MQLRRIVNRYPNIEQETMILIRRTSGFSRVILILLIFFLLESPRSTIRRLTSLRYQRWFLSRFKGHVVFLPPSKVSSSGKPVPVPLRILEIGIGKDCRVLRRGLYEEGLKQVASLGVSNVDILGIDLSSNLPSERILQKTQESLEKTASRYGIQANLNVQEL